MINRSTAITIEVTRLAGVLALVAEGLEPLVDGAQQELGVAVRLLDAVHEAAGELL